MIQSVHVHTHGRSQVAFSYDEDEIERSAEAGTGLFGLADLVWPFRSGDISVMTFLYINNTFVY